jgi:hypothetical protein
MGGNTVIKVAIIFNQRKLSGKLTRFFTGEYAYHIGFLHIESDTFFDMHILPRKVSWAAKKYYEYTLHDCHLTKEDCEAFLKRDSLDVRYGVMDYTLFALRGLYHLFGKSTRNANGWICSEMVNNWLWRKTDKATAFDPELAPPSPADFVRFYRDR